MPSSTGSSGPKNRNCVSCGSCVIGEIFTTEPPGKPPILIFKGNWLLSQPTASPSTHTVISLAQKGGTFKEKG